MEEDEEDKFGDDLIKPTSFYSAEHEKTKLNWFCYEIALSFEFEIKRKLGEKLKRYKIYEKDIADFSVYFAKKMKGIVLQQLSGEIEKVYFSYEMVESYFPMLSDRMVNKMLDAIAKAWDEQLGVCEICPTRCVSEKDVYCTMFDEGPY
ncbi:MAG: hypothetical protein U9O85_07750 [Euryarchaeota archaeon]|nr:hypothetical protein [Euryarchaeota archaeon]